MYAQAQKTKKHRLFDFLFRNATRIFAFFVFVLFAAIIVVLFLGSLPTIQKLNLSFLIRTEWNPITEEFGAFSAIFGTLVSTGIALIIAVPTSFGIALFLTELSPGWLRGPLSVMIELLAGIPSIIYGMWGLFVFVPFFAESVQPRLTIYTAHLPVLNNLFQGPPIGIGLLSAGIILSIMIIPFISSVMRDIFAAVPAMLKESAYGLGCTTWEIMRYIVIPFSKQGVVSAIILGLGRALGETMAVTFVIGNSPTLARSLFDPATTIAATLANQFTEATGTLHLSALIELGLILFIITFVILALTKLLLLRSIRFEATA